MVHYNNRTANGFRAAQVGNLRKDPGYDQVCVTVQLKDDRGTAYPAGECFIVGTPDGRFLSSIVLSRRAHGDYRLTPHDLTEIRYHADRFIESNGPAIRALGPRNMMDDAHA